MKIWFNLAMSAVVAIVVVVSLTSAKSILLKPISVNQSRSDISSVKQSSDIHSNISYNDDVEKSSTDATTNTTLVMSPLNTITMSSEDITTEMSTSNNIITSTFVQETPLNTYANTTSTEDTTTTITSVDMVTENQTTTAEAPKRYGGYHHGSHHIIKNHHYSKTTSAPICPKGQTVNSNGGCSPIFVDL